MILATVSVARAEPALDAVAAAPTTPPPAVAPEPQDVKVGDVIMAPPLEEPDAAELQEQREETAASRTGWYGAPILIGDGIAYACLAGAVVMEDDTASVVLVPPCLLGYALVGPITHATHGNWVRAGVSALTRAGLPLTGMVVVGVSVCRGDGGNDDVDDGGFSNECAYGIGGGLALGMLGATALDAALLAGDPVAQEQPRAHVEPLLSLGTHHAFLGAAGAF
jgi:hypothetical protein